MLAASVDAANTHVDDVRTMTLAQAGQVVATARQSLDDSVAEARSRYRDSAGGPIRRLIPALTARKEYTRYRHLKSSARLWRHYANDVLKSWSDDEPGSMYRLMDLLARIPEFRPWVIDRVSTWNLTRAAQTVHLQKVSAEARTRVDALIAETERALQARRERQLVKAQEEIQPHAAATRRAFEELQNERRAAGQQV